MNENLFVGLDITGGTEVQTVSFSVPPSIFSAFIERVVRVSPKGDDPIEYGIEGVNGVYRSVRVLDGENIRGWWR